jgi:diaminopimelate decarboxylase
LARPPGSVERNYVRSGRFWIDGVRLPDILDKHPTPCYIYSANVIRENYQRLRDHLPAYEIFFSLKANPNLAICRILLGLGANADVSSLGELKAALKVGFKPENILFVGPGKTDDEIRYAITNGVFAIVAESPHEVGLIDAIAGKIKKKARIVLRINTLEKPIAPEIMVGGPSKFGIDEETAIESVGSLQLRHSTIVGVHVYSASQVLDPDFHAMHINYVGDLALHLAEKIGFELECVDFGGGFGVPYKDGEPEMDLGPVAQAAEAVGRKVLEASPGCRLAFEVGRYIAAEAGIFLTKVIRVKNSRGKRFIITDAGLNHFTRPIFQCVNHPSRILNKIGDEPAGAFDVCGPICTPLDVTARGVELPEPEIGDVIGLFNAGAYGYSMSMTDFMSLGWPAEVMIDDGRMYVIRKPRMAEEFFGDQPLK